MEQGVIQSSGIIMNRGGILGNFGGIIITDSDTLDPDAAARISEIEAAGATVSPTQAAAINTFFVDAKADGYYSSLKRLYLPIWGVAAANAIDLITGAVGTFNGGVTHGAGFVKGNGTTGYFDLGTDPTTVGMSLVGMHLVALVYVSDTRTGNRYYLGSRNNSATGAGEVDLYQQLDQVTSILSRSPVTTTASIAEPYPTAGIFCGRRESATSITNARRLTAGYLAGTTQTNDNSGNDISTLNVYAMGLNSQASLVIPSDASFGSYGMGLGLTATQSQDYTLALKNLWETATGLTLP